MSKLHRFHESNYPYFVTTTTIGREPMFEDQNNARLIKDILYQTRARYRFLLLGFVLMPDHLHAVLLPRNSDTISQVMRFIKGTSARAYNERLSRTGAVWQPSFYDRAIRDEAALRTTLSYIEQNPVKAGIVDDVQQYKFSSAYQDSQTDLEVFLGGQA